jgi:hypothetical protein
MITLTLEWPSLSSMITLTLECPSLSMIVFDPKVSTSLCGSPLPPSDSSKWPAFLPPRKAHSSGGPQVVSTSHPPASYRLAPPPPQPAQPNLDRSTSHLPASYRPAPSPSQPAQPNFDRSNPQLSVPKPPHGDTLVHANTTKDRRSPGPPASVKASARESPNSSTVDPALKSPATATANGPVAERRAPQPPAAPQQHSAAVASLTKTFGVAPRPRERKKEDKANDADIVKRLQQICTDADPTWLYRDLVKSGQEWACRFVV